MGRSDGRDSINDAEELDRLFLDQQAAAARADEMRRPPQLARSGRAAMSNVLRESLALRIEIEGGDALSEIEQSDRDMGSGPGARPMVNWDVVAKNIDGVVALARDGWKKIAG